MIELIKQIKKNYCEKGFFNNLPRFIFTDEDIALLKNVIEDQDKLIKVMDGFKVEKKSLNKRKIS